MADNSERTLIEKITQLYMSRVFSSVISKIIGRLKAEKYNLDADIPASTLIFLVLYRFKNLLSGIIKCFGMTGGRLPVVFVGEKVALRNKKFISIGRSVSIGHHACLDGLSKEGLKIGDNVSLGPYVSIQCTGSLRYMGKGCSIGNNTGIGAYSFIGAAGGVQIGRDVIMGQWVSFHSENHNFDNTDILIRLQGVNHQGIVIEDDCWIGTKATFLDGAHVGKGCVVAAGSVVRGHFPPYSVIAGAPAKVIKSRKADKE